MFRLLHILIQNHLFLVKLLNDDGLQEEDVEEITSYQIFMNLLHTCS